MTDIASPLPEVRPEARNLLPLKLAITIALAALADWLFYAQRVGLSMAMFAVVLFAASWLGNRIRFDRHRLLAAGFVLLAMRPGGGAAKSAIIRPLVYFWVGQNVLLVISSMLRLYRYVEIYMLTGWRIAALVWMLLVAIGLVLIVTRIVLGQTNGWLVRMNLISLTATLYLCSLVNFAAVIADYNVTHSKEASGKGVNFDTNYLYELGLQALPALDRARLLPMVTIRDCGRNRLLATQTADMASWRSWGFRSSRLQRYLDGRQDKPAAAG